MTSSSGHEPLVAEGHEPGEDRRDLHAGEMFLAALGVADRDREVEREPGDVRERVCRVDGEWREHREDPLGEQLLHLLLLVDVELTPPQHRDALADEARHQVVPEELAVAAHQVPRLAPDRLEDLARHHPAGRRHGDAGSEASLEAGHPHHEELVEVAGEDRHEPGAFEQRKIPVRGQLEHARVEVQPGQLTVEKTSVGEVVELGFVRRFDVEGVARVASARLVLDEGV